jgi:hypothetical protein
VITVVSILYGHDKVFSLVGDNLAAFYYLGAPEIWFDKRDAFIEETI